MLQSAAKPPRRRREQANDEQHDSKSGEDPREHHQHMVRDAPLRKLRRERIRHAQRNGQTAEHQEAFDPRHCRTQAGPEQGTEADGGYEDAPQERPKESLSHSFVG